MTVAPVPGRLPAARLSGARPDGPLVIALHGEGTDIHDLTDLALELVPAREVIAPVGCWGTYVGAMDLSNYTWFHEVPGVADPEPVSFGRSLLDVEQLIHSLGAAADSPRPVLIGIGQGATVALASAAVVPEALAAVVAIGGRPVTLPAGAISLPAGVPVPPRLWLAEPAEGERAEAVGGFGSEPSDPSLSVLSMPAEGPFAASTKAQLKEWVAEQLA
ncbi:MAG TPA: hypothetical protein VMF55_01775 [Solirubrobacterales bacterium]|nr:hypothetical protein [Solirubrobacterales bacterium]